MIGSAGAAVLAALEHFRPGDDDEQRDLEQVRALAASADPWPRSLPLHVTGSAIIIHPPSGRVLLRWHQRQGAWLQVGGHGDPGEKDPSQVALREASEETGLPDLQPWPTPEPSIVQVVIVPVPPGKGEPAHHHADIRYTLASLQPEAATPEAETAPLEWLDIDAALVRAGDGNLRVALRRVEKLLAG